MTEQMTVRCPHCDHEFQTHAVGDVTACEECDKTFNRFRNGVRGDS